MDCKHTEYDRKGTEVERRAYALHQDITWNLGQYIGDPVERDDDIELIRVWIENVMLQAGDPCIPNGNLVHKRHKTQEIKSRDESKVQFSRQSFLVCALIMVVRSDCRLMKLLKDFCDVLWKHD